MGAAVHQDHTLRGLDGERELLQLERTGNLRGGGYEKDAWADLRRRRDGDEVSLWPGSAGGQRLGRLAVEISHLLGQGFVLPIEAVGNTLSKSPEGLIGGVDRHVGIDGEQVAQP